LGFYYILEESKIEENDVRRVGYKFVVFVDGSWHGSAAHPLQVYQEFAEEK
tara:strand:+ start:1914 stop:2066 length:153 start_codon:yes stop_codon:yes gene_type:complete